MPWPLLWRRCRRRGRTVTKMSSARLRRWHLPRLRVSASSSVPSRCAAPPKPAAALGDARFYSRPGQAQPGDLGFSDALVGDSWMRVAQHGDLSLPGQPLCDLAASSAPYRGQALPLARTALTQLRAAIAKRLDAERTARLSILDERETQLRATPEFQALPDAMIQQVLHLTKEARKTVNEARFIPGIRDRVSRYFRRTFRPSMLSPPGWPRRSRPRPWINPPARSTNPPYRARFIWLPHLSACPAACPTSPPRRISTHGWLLCGRPPKLSSKMEIASICK